MADLLVIGGYIAVAKAIPVNCSRSFQPIENTRYHCFATKRGRKIASTPGSSTITRAYGDLTASCQAPNGWTGANSVSSSTAGSAFGNIIAGGLIGAAVDMSSGAAYQYPSSITVSLSQSAPGQLPGSTPAASPTVTPAVVSSTAPAIPTNAPANSLSRPEDQIVCQVGSNTSRSSRESCASSGGTVLNGT